MFKIIAVTNRKLCKGDFLEQIKKLCNDPRIGAIVLREKDLSEAEYLSLAQKVIDICSRYNKELILHNFVDAAIKLNFPDIHLSIPKIFENTDKLKYFENIGVSVHSIEQVEIANKSGASYMFAGHIFVTDCKKGLPPRGIEFLRDTVQNADCPVYAIGGIDKSRLNDVKKAGAAGACIMSGAMADKIDI